MESNEITAIVNTNDTICAISTPSGVGGIAVARVSGPKAIEITDIIWRGRPLSQALSHTAHLGTILDTSLQPLDQALATVFRAPASFTGQNTVEISVHGSRYVQAELLNSLVKAGCRLALPGEFTRRAFTAGHLDLAQAEAVADIIASSSRAAHRLAINQMRGGLSSRISSLRNKLVDLTSLLELELDFSEEEVEFASRQQLLDLAIEINREVSRLSNTYRDGRAIKEGIPTAIVGATNAGKSSLLNLLAGDDRAIVSDIHGTTRDTIEETVTIGDYLYRFIDTAGLRPTSDTIEQIGQQRSLRAISHARIILALIDSTAPFNTNSLAPAIEAVDKDNENAPTVVLILNKTDLSALPETTAQASQYAESHSVPLVELSAKTGDGLSQLIQLLNDTVAPDSDSTHEDTVMVTNLRHATLLEEAARSSQLVIDGLQSNLPGDLIAQDLRHTLSLLSSITGEIPSTEILSTIFSRFCIGK